MFESHRANAEELFKKNIFTKIIKLSEKCEIELSTPLQCHQQRYRSNPGLTDPEDYFRITIFIPYLDGLIQSLKLRFADGESSINHLSLFVLPPKLLKTTSKKVYDKHIKNINEFYNISNLDIKSELWYNLYLEDKSFDKKSITELFNETSLFPSNQKCFKILLMFPVTTCSIERSFSSMTRIKTLLRTSMTDERLSNLVNLSINANYIEKDLDQFGSKVINKFSLIRKRRLKF